MPRKNDTTNFYVLADDKQWAKDRIAELEKAIQDLGPEFYIAVTQSNETWHDNAPFDALRDEQAVLVAEMQQLKEVLFKAALRASKPGRGKAGIGSRIEVSDGTKTHAYILAGHWSPHVNKKQDGALVVTCAAPLGTVLLGAKVGQEIIIPTNKKSLGHVTAIA